MDVVLSGIFGALVGIGELVSRYRDAPTRALLTIPALLYMALNAAAAVAAILLMQVFDWNFGVTGENAIRWTRVIAAGFGAMAIFRTSLFSIRIGDQDVGIGPVSFLQVVLGAADRAVDRDRAQGRAKVVKEVMSGVDFRKANEALPAFSFALMQSLPEEEQRLFANQVNLIVGAKMPSDVKSLMLGLALMNLVGEDVLKSAVSSLKEDISQPRPPAPQPESKK
jgi:hypothetical protein